jgi:putative ubiquitin-RnfH superfamily antitoxin RatB of RatAB toxin-antitoxin module
MADIRVQVCYARAGMTWLREIAVPVGATVQAAIELSGMLDDVPEIDLTACRVGIYGKLTLLDALLREQDRVEIYRPLIADPKNARRRRPARKSDADAAPPG